MLLLLLLDEGPDKKVVAVEECVVCILKVIFTSKYVRTKGNSEARVICSRILHFNSMEHT